MDTLKVVRRVPCVAAWKCPACGRITAAQTERAYWSSCDLDRRISAETLRMQLARKTFEAHACGQYDDFDRWLGQVQQHEQEDHRSLGRLCLALPLAKLRCQACGHVPAWCRDFSRVSKLANVLCAVAGLVMMTAVLQLLKAPPLAWIFGAVAVLGAMGVILQAISESRMRRALTELSEAEHLPRLAYTAAGCGDGEDPRAAAINAYLRTHPDMSFEHAISSEIQRQRIEPD